MPTTATKSRPPKKSTTRPKKRNVQALPPIEAVATPRPRRLRLPPYRPFRFKRIQHPDRLPSAWSVGVKAARLLAKHWRLFAGMVLLYAVLNLILVRGFSGGADIDSLKQQFSQGVHGNLGQLAVSFSVFTSLLASAGNGSSPAAGAYQLFLGLIISLATIYALRKLTAGERVALRDAFYQGMYPLIPFIVVLCMILLQTLPFLVGGGLFTLMINFGIAVHTLEKVAWGLVFAVLALVSVFMLCSSLFGLYIVTLPGMRPRQALKSARQLVRYRRLVVFRKLCFLPLALLVMAAAIMLPFILFLPPAAPWVLFVLTMLALPVIHAYMYTLYRELIA